MGVVKRITLFSIMLFSVIIPGYIYVYFRGLDDGIMLYKRSYNMIKALESAYNFGLRDGLNRSY